MFITFSTEFEIEFVFKFDTFGGTPPPVAVLRKAKKGKKKKSLNAFFLLMYIYVNLKFSMNAPPTGRPGKFSRS